MRRAPGGPVRLFNGHDGEWLARIAILRRDRASLVVERVLRPQAGEPDLWLAFAVLKRDATDLVAQKATELGIAALLPVLTERTNAVRVNAARLAAIAIEAAEQSERLTVPAIHELAAPRPPPSLLARRAAAVRRHRAPARAARPVMRWARGSADRPRRRFHGCGA